MLTLTIPIEVDGLSVFLGLTLILVLISLTGALLSTVSTEFRTAWLPSGLTCILTILFFFLDWTVGSYSSTVLKYAFFLWSSTFFIDALCISTSLLSCWRLLNTFYCFIIIIILSFFIFFTHSFYCFSTSFFRSLSIYFFFKPSLGSDYVRGRSAEPELGLGFR